MTATYSEAAARRLCACSLVLTAWTCSVAFAGAQQPKPTAAGRHFDHVVLVVMENQGSRQALADPNIATLVKAGAWFSNYHALAHPSLPNYLGLVGGNTFGVVRDHVTAPIQAPTIVARLEAKRLSWKAYAEDYPGACFLGSGAGQGYLTPKAKPTALYGRQHVPFLSFASIQSDRARCSHVVNAREFMRDARAGKLPNYAFYTPNMFNDGHDTGLERSTAWLKDFVQSLRSTVAMHQRTLLVITWDEGGGEDFRSNRVLAILIGDGIVPGRYADWLTHYSLLRTIEDNFGLPPIADGDANASPVPDKVWRD
jgi:hypothetical protein